VQQARAGLAAGLTAGLRRLDARLRETRKKPAAAIRACGSTVTRASGVGPVIAATVTGDVRDVSRFASRDCSAACNGTAPIEVSSGNREVHRLSRRGNRRLNHAIHMAAVTQVRYRHSDGRACYGKKLAGGKTPKEALRALKRQVSDAICEHLKADAARAAAAAGARDPGGHAGERLCRQRGRLTPRMPALRPGHSRTRPHPATRSRPCEDYGRTPAEPADRAPQRGRPWPARSSCPQGPQRLRGQGRPSGRRRRRCAAALRPEGRPRSMRGTPRRTQRRRSRLHLPS
jgi:hypothetical protein